jgi:hypothetical protein
MFHLIFGTRRRIGVAIFSIFILEIFAQQPTLLFSPTSTVNGSSYSEVKNPVALPVCDPSVNTNDTGNSFFNIPALNRIWGGAYTHLKRGLPNCKIMAQGTGNVWIAGNGSNIVRVQWWCHSNAQYDCLDPDCSWYALDTSTISARVVILIGGVPNGTPVTVSYLWKHFSSIANRPEINEDNAEIQNASLNLFGREGFGNQLNLSGATRYAQRRTGNDSIQTINMTAGDSLVINVSALTLASIYPPAQTVDNEREDDAFADFFGYVEIEVTIPGNPVTIGSSCPVAALLYSVDIGGDTELSDPIPDGNELLDPGDLYAWGGASPIPFFDDSTIFGFDPAPDINNPAGTCNPSPFQPWQSILNFDIDGADRIDYDLYANLLNFGPGNPSIAPYTTDCIYSPAYLLLSYDEDRGVHYNNDIWCDIPSAIGLNFQADSVFVKGTPFNNDEILYSNLINIPGTGKYIGSAGSYRDEQGVSTLLAPSPVTLFPPDRNDDVDALDYIGNPAQCGIQYFSVDHEAHYIKNGDTLRAGIIYQNMGNGVVQPVIHPMLHLGLSNDIDIDAFEFAWLFDSLQQRLGLALVFSVSTTDPFSAIDYSGGLDPGALYASFLNGSYFEMLPPVAPGNIDAITFGCEPFIGYGSTYTPPAIFTGMNEKEWNDIRLDIYPNPNTGHFNVEFLLKEKSTVSLSVFELNGKPVGLSNHYILPAGKRKISVSLNDISNGLYFVQLKISSENKFNSYSRKISVYR